MEKYKFKWYEYLYMGLILVMVTVLGIIFKSSILIVINSLLGMLATFFFVKGLNFGNVLGILQAVIYCILCFFNKYYGEIISAVCLSIPLYIMAIIYWAKNKDAKSNAIKINKKISNKEWLMSIFLVTCLSIGMYFVLRALGNANLIVSAISFGVITLAEYFRLRRYDKNFILSCLGNIISFVLWLLIVIDGNLNYIPTIINYVVYFSLNVYGLFHWVRLKKVQNEIKADNNQDVNNQFIQDEIDNTNN